MVFPYANGNILTAGSFNQLFINSNTSGTAGMASGNTPNILGSLVASANDFKVGDNIELFVQASTDSTQTGSIDIILSGALFAGTFGIGSVKLVNLGDGGFSTGIIHREIMTVRHSGTTTTDSFALGWERDGDSFRTWNDTKLNDTVAYWITGTWAILFRGNIDAAGSIFFQGAMNKRYGGYNVL